MNRTWPVRLRRSLRIWRGVHAKAVWNTGSRLRGADCEERDGRPGIDQEPRHQVGQRARRWLQGGPLRPLWDGAQGGTDIGFLLKLFKGVSYSLFHRASPVSSIFSGLEIPWQIAAIGSWDPLLISHVFCLNFFECWIELHVIAFGCMWLHLIVDCRLICICRLHCVFFSFFFVLEIPWQIAAIGSWVFSVVRFCPVVLPPAGPWIQWPLGDNPRGPSCLFHRTNRPTPS